MGHNLIECSSEWWRNKFKTEYTNKELNSQFIVNDAIGLALQNIDISADKNLSFKTLHIVINPKLSQDKKQEIISYLNLNIITEDEEEGAYDNGKINLVVIDNDETYELCLDNATEVIGNDLRAINACQFLLNYLTAYYYQCTEFFEQYNGLVDGFDSFVEYYRKDEQHKPKEYDFTALNLFKLLTSILEAEYKSNEMIANNKNLAVVVIQKMVKGDTTYTPGIEAYEYDFDFNAEYIDEWLDSFGVYTYFAEKLLSVVNKNKLVILADSSIVNFIQDLSTVQQEIHDLITNKKYDSNFYWLDWDDEIQQVNIQRAW